MILLLPFINAFLLFITIVPNQLFHKPYRKFLEKVVPRLRVPSKVLGGCVMCTAFWMGVIQCVILYSIGIDIKTLAMLLFYIPVATAALFKLSL